MQGSYEEDGLIFGRHVVYEEDWERLEIECSGMLPGAAKAHEFNASADIEERIERARHSYRFESVPSFRGHAERAAKGGGVSALTHRQWGLVRKIFGHACAYCGRQVGGLTIDHIEPLSKGGDHAVYNVLPACRSCNSSKHDSDLAGWCARKAKPLGLIRARICVAYTKLAKRLGSPNANPLMAVVERWQ